MIFEFKTIDLLGKSLSANVLELFLNAWDVNQSSSRMLAERGTPSKSIVLN